MSLRQQLEDMEIGETLVTFQNRNGIYVAAKRAKVNVTTAVQNDASILITKTKYETKPEMDTVLPPQSGVECTVLVLKNMKTADRMSVFEEFELCCGMNRGGCVCPDEEIVVNKPIQGGKQALLSDLRGKIGAIEGGATKIPWKPEPIEEEWVFVGTSVQFADDGNAYRGQLLLPHGKKRRSVQVDPENHGSIIRIV